MSNYEHNTNRIIKIEPNPYIKPSIKLRMTVIETAGGKPRYIESDGSKKILKTKEKEAKGYSRLPNTVVEYSAPLMQSGKLKTGLDVIVSNPYRDEVSYKDNQWEQIFSGKDKVRLQEVLEYKHDKPKGYYTSNVVGIIASNKLHEGNFYQQPESRVNMRDGINYLNMDNPIHEVNYYMLYNHPQIAKNFADLKNKPDATHYIVDDNEKKAIEVDNVRKYNKLGYKLENLMSSPTSEFINFAKALNIYRDSIDNKEELYTLIDSHCRNDDRNLDDFNTFYDLWLKHSTREEFLCYAEIFDLVSHNVLSVRGNTYYWQQTLTEGGRKEQWEWKSKNDLIHRFMLEPKYREELDSMRNDLRNATR